MAEMIQQCVNENARIALDQTEYQKKYDGLADRFDRIKGRLEAVGSGKNGEVPCGTGKEGRPADGV